MSERSERTNVIGLSRPNERSEARAREHSERTNVIGRAVARFGVLLVAAALVVVAPAVGAFPIESAAARATTTPLSGVSVTMTIDDVSPNTPVAGYTKRPLTVLLSLHNNTARTLRVQVTADRGDPIGSQAALDLAIARPKAPSADLVAHVIARPRPVTLLAASTAEVVFTTTTNIPRDAGICLCHDAIYPLYFTARTTSGQPGTVVGATQTYLPVFGTTRPRPVLVSWLWPLLERPHRLSEPATGQQVFLDDRLAADVATGGRLDRMLRVVERVATRVDLTLVIDPELIDELAVMSTGPYVVPSATGNGNVPGIGGTVAAEWLQRLRTVLDRNPRTELDFIPFADPDIAALSEKGLPWRMDSPDARSRARVRAALGGRTPLHDIAWPAGPSIDATTLNALVRRGTRTVLVHAGFVGGRAPRATTDALSPLRPATRRVLAAVTSPGIERAVNRVLAPGGPGIGELPQLVSQVAIRAVQRPAESHFVVIAPTRYVNPDPATAARAILTTAFASWSRPLALRAATKAVTPVERVLLRRQHTVAALPEASLTSVGFVDRSLPGMRSMFSRADEATLLGPLPAALQRSTSLAWTGDARRSIQQSGALAGQVRRLLNGVSLVEPAGNKTYTLTATDSSVPITVKNNLAVDVHVRISAHAANGLSGFAADRVRVQTIPAGNVQQVSIPTHIVRTGRIDVVVELASPSGLQLGVARVLKVRSTALGTVGVAITTGAGIVLVLALMVRAVGYLRRRNQPRIPVRGPDDIGAT